MRKERLALSGALQHTCPKNVWFKGSWSSFALNIWRERKSYPEGVRCGGNLNQFNWCRIDENLVIFCHLLSLFLKPSFNRIRLEVQYLLFVCLLLFSICLYSLGFFPPVVQFLLALFRRETCFPVHTLFSSNQEKVIAERRIPVLQSQLEEYKSILCQLQAQKYKLQTEVLSSPATNHGAHELLFLWSSGKTPNVALTWLFNLMDLEVCFPLRFPSFPSAVSFPFSQWSELSGLDGQGGYCRCNEAVFAYQSGWWGRVSTMPLDSCRTESAGRCGWKSPTGLPQLSHLLSSGWKLAPWKVMENPQGSAQSFPSLPHPVLSLLWEGADRFGEQNWEGCWATFGFLPSSVSLLSTKPASLLCLDTTSRKIIWLLPSPDLQGMSDQDFD